MLYYRFHTKIEFKFRRGDPNKPHQHYNWLLKLPFLFIITVDDGPDDDVWLHVCDGCDTVIFER